MATWIWHSLMQKHQGSKEESWWKHDLQAQTWIGIVCPNILKKLNASITLSGVCHAISNGADRFEVNHWDSRFIVDLQARECSCRYWNLSGLPCCHANSCIFYNTNVLDDYIAACYHITEFNNTYSHCLNPLEGMHNWPESDLPPLKAPRYVRMPSRHKKKGRGSHKNNQRQRDFLR